MKILIVEDDNRIAAPMAENLCRQHYTVDIASDGLTALQLAEKNEYDLLLLDVMLPRVNGVEVCRSLRQRGFKGFVLMLTARGSKDDKILGLDSGADDYLVKPFDIDELNARVRSFVRRTKETHDGEILCCGALEVDQRACAVTFAGVQIPLTPTEYRLLVHFLRNPNRTFSKNELVERLWSDDLPTDTVVKAHIKTLRQKLESAKVSRDLIVTVYGFGYRLNKNAR